ncbi:MAG: helix-turn-helix domain-containing protein [Pantoea agglomerans]
MTLTPTEEVQCFLSLLHSGQTPSAAAKQAGLNPHESILIRKLAGLHVNSHQQNIPEKVVYLRSQGMTYKQIAQNLNISRSYVNIILQRHRSATR